MAPTVPLVAGPFRVHLPVVTPLVVRPLVTPRWADPVVERVVVGGTLGEA